MKYVLIGLAFVYALILGTGVGGRDDSTPLAKFVRAVVGNLALALAVVVLFRFAVQWAVKP